jgi:hypothetical protein
MAFINGDELVCAFDSGSVDCFDLKTNKPSSLFVSQHFIVMMIFVEVRETRSLEAGSKLFRG